MCEQDGHYHEIYPELGLGDNEGGGPEVKTYGNIRY